MSPQPISSSPLRPNLSASQLRLDADTCPACGQQIPHDRYEEISGKIAMRDHEQALALKAKLEQQLAIERAEADAKAKADLAHAREETERTVRELQKAYAIELAKAREEAARTAEARALDAEKKLAAVASEHAATLAANLTAQREVMEKAKEDALNAEKAKAFEETQKLAARVSDLQRALEKKTNEELGEGAEVNLFEELKANFPDDSISRIAKGSPGADIRHIVMVRGRACGTILYDSKNHNQFRSDHVTKLKQDQLADRAEHAILSTHKFPQGTRQLHVEDGIVLANPARVVSVATMIRTHMVQLHTLRLSTVEREEKTARLYEFITSDRCTQLLGRVNERAGELLDLQTKETRWHELHWKKQGEALRAIQKAEADLENEISDILGATATEA